ncbi:MAG: hypothetical protein RR540_06225 [Oscillospiraceae bacterium]
MIFFPDDFIPNADFCANAESFCVRAKPKLLWIDNPIDSYMFWNCTACGNCSNPSINIGEYCVCLNSFKNENDNSITFNGDFHTSSVCFSLSSGGIVLDLSTKTGEVSFSFICPKNTNLFSALNSGIKYVMPLSSETENNYENNFTAEFHNSILKSSDDLIISALITPSALLDTTKTYLGLPKGNYQSNLLAPNGYLRNLNAVNAKLVLEKTALVIAYDDSSNDYSYSGMSWYFGISGEFVLLSENDSGNSTLLGLSASEFISSDSKLEILFMPHNNALICTNKVPPKSNNCTISTAWISFKGTYFSSSKSMPLFNISNNSSSNATDYLRAYIPAVISFTEFSPAAPFISWKDVDISSEYALQAENILCTSRFDIFTKQAEKSMLNFCDSNASHNSTTAVAPCGLCVSISNDNGGFDWIGIAQTSSESLPNVRLNSPSAKTRFALQQKECELTALTPEEFNSLGIKSNTITLPIDGWELILSEKYWEKDKTLFYIKYNSTISIREKLIDTPQLDNILSLSYTGDGKLRPEFEEIISILDDTNFQGILIFGAVALPSKVAPEVKAVTDDIKSGDIKAIYTIINTSRVDISGSGEIIVSKSNISSLFSYTGKSLVNENHSDIKLAFCTVGLKVIIKQTIIQQFNSRSELMISELMGASLVPSAYFDGKSLVLNGVLETISGNSFYKFSLAYPATFNSPNTPIDEIVFDEIKMVCQTDKTDFVLSGKISFIKTADCDIFSFQSIPFRGIKISKIADILFAEYSSADFMQEFADVRANSFAEAFGGKISYTILGSNKNTPDELGFCSISTPVQQGTLGDIWNGIVWSISLGSSGELGDSSELAFEIITAWSGSNYYIGLQLSDVFAKNFSLQGFLTAKFSGLELQNGESGTLYFKLHGFTLKMLGLSFPQNGMELLILGEHGKIAWYSGYQPKE